MAHVNRAPFLLPRTPRLVLLVEKGRINYMLRLPIVPLVPLGIIIRLQVKVNVVLVYRARIRVLQGRSIVLNVKRVHFNRPMLNRPVTIVVRASIRLREE